MFIINNIIFDSILLPFLCLQPFFICFLTKVWSHVQSNTSYWNQWMLSLWERQTHGGAYLITRVFFWLVSWFMCPYVHTYSEDLLMWFYVTYPAFFFVFFSTAVCCVQLYCSTLDFLGLPPLEKSHLTLCSKTHICLLKRCTQVNIL